MNRRLLMTRVAAALGALMLSGAIGHAAEVKVLTSVALKSVLDELSPSSRRRPDTSSSSTTGWRRIRRNAFSTASAPTSSS